MKRISGKEHNRSYCVRIMWRCKGAERTNEKMNDVEWHKKRKMGSLKKGKEVRYNQTNNTYNFG